MMGDGEQELFHMLFLQLSWQLKCSWGSQKVSKRGSDPQLLKVDRIGVYGDEEGIVAFMSVNERMALGKAKALFELMFGQFPLEVQQYMDNNTHRFNTIDGERIQRMVLVAEALRPPPAVTVRPGPVEYNLAVFDEASASEATVALVDQPSSSTSLVPHGPNVYQPSSSTSLVPYGPSVSTILALPEPESVALLTEAEGKLTGARLEKERLCGEVEELTDRLRNLDAKMLRSGNGRAWRAVVLKLAQQNAETKASFMREAKMVVIVNILKKQNKQKRVSLEVLREAERLTGQPLERLRDECWSCLATQKLSNIGTMFSRHALDVPPDELDLRDPEVKILERLGHEPQRKLEATQRDLDCTTDLVVEAIALVEERKKERDLELAVLQQRKCRATQVYLDLGSAPFYATPKAKEDQVVSFLMQEVQRRTKSSSDQHELARTITNVAYDLVKDGVLDETYSPSSQNGKTKLVNIVESVTNSLVQRDEDEDEEVKAKEETEVERKTRMKVESKAHLAAFKEMRPACSTCAECLGLDYMHGHFCATHAPEFDERKKKYAKAAQQTPRFPERGAAAAAKPRSTKKAKGDNRALRKEIYSRVDECMNGSTSMKCSQCGNESSSCVFLHYPTEMWWRMDLEPAEKKELEEFIAKKKKQNDAEAKHIEDEIKLLGGSPADQQKKKEFQVRLKELRKPVFDGLFDSRQVGETQFIFCGRECENEWADTLQCRLCGGTEWKRSQMPFLDTHDPRRLLLEDEWRREAVKRGNMAKRQVQLGMIHPVRSRDPVLLRELEQCREQLYRTPNNEILAMEFKERRNAMGYTREEVEQRQAELYCEAFDETLAKLEAGSMKAKVLRAPICAKGCMGAAQSTMGPRLNRERLTEPIVAEIGETRG